MVFKTVAELIAHHRRLSDDSGATKGLEPLSGDLSEKDLEKATDSDSEDSDDE